MARHYTGYVPSDEPCVIGPDEVAQYLERRGMVRMAAWVRGVETTRQRAAFMHERLADDYARVLARLHAYEPPAPVHEPHCPFPPPERSD